MLIVVLFIIEVDITADLIIGEMRFIDERFACGQCHGIDDSAVMARRKIGIGFGLYLCADRQKCAVRCKAGFCFLPVWPAVAVVVLCRFPPYIDAEPFSVKGQRREVGDRPILGQGENLLGKDGGAVFVVLWNFGRGFAAGGEEKDCQGKQCECQMFHGGGSFLCYSL